MTVDVYQRKMPVPAQDIVVGAISYFASVPEKLDIELGVGLLSGDCECGWLVGGPPICGFVAWHPGNTCFRSAGAYQSAERCHSESNNNSQSKNSSQACRSQDFHIACMSAVRNHSNIRDR